MNKEIIIKVTVPQGEAILNALWTYLEDHEGCKGLGTTKRARAQVDEAMSGEMKR